DPLNDAGNQGLNRYSYVLNNPLALTDPTGYMSWGQALRMVAAIVITVYTGGAAAGAWSFFGAEITAGSASAYLVAGAGGFAAGVIQTDSLNGGLYGAFSAELFYGIGQGIDHAGWAQAESGQGTLGTHLNSVGYTSSVVAHGIAGGVMSSLQGGKFGSGFAAAGFAQFASPATQGFGHVSTRVVVASIIGGTASELSGGKFGNGAVTAGFSQAFSEAAIARRGQVVPEGADPENYHTMYVGGAHGDLADFTGKATADPGTFGYFLPSEGGVTDIVRSISEKFSSDGFSDDLSAVLAGVDHPFAIVAYSEGTAVVANAALNGGLPQGSVLYFNSPIISYATASAAANAINSPLMMYNLPRGDVANFIAPGRNFFSGFYDLTHGMQVHDSTQFAH
ncbi:MAG TPA: hypothetical protein VFN13_08250, partial [Rudaea sp.]|nr:hypothetical protein [Rudaea sp.]